MDTMANSSLNAATFFSCVSSIPTRHIFTAWFTAYLLLLPVFLLVLYFGFNKWKKPQSSASGGLSHSDVFTLHMVTMEIMCIIGSCVVCYGYYRSVKNVLRAADSIFATIFTGQMPFHTLTCVERYLAVVHPVTYLRLRGEGGVTVRNTSIALVWVLSVVYCLVTGILNNIVLYGSLGMFLCFASLPLVSYCSIYVVHVLTRPKPGEKGGHRKQTNQSKRCTVYTMVAILGALLLRLIFYVVYSCINIWFWREIDACVVITTTFWLVLPSSLVLPLLFLHRTGKLPNKARK